MYPNSPTPESPLAAELSGFMCVSLLAFLFCCPQPSGKSRLNSPTGLRHATELAGWGPGFCWVSALKQEQLCPQKGRGGPGN